ncbi:MAG TPA: amylo-alpha-1,6-glucosidase [Steroidobacteraceae bacterium]|nr:amylo-alpha-1,6-glucosidase [Steroidobacteraceae bacterium]
MTRFAITLPAAGDGAAWRNREWIVTNGLGGYASGTLAGVCTRRYHGMFVPNLARPRGRHVLVSRLDEEVSYGEQTWRLGGSDREGQALAGCSAPLLRSFSMDGNIACWVYQCGAVTLERQLVMPHQRNTSCLRYVITGGPAAQLRVRPFMAFRRQDAPLQRPGYGRFGLGLTEEGSCRIILEDSELWLAMCLLPGRAAFIAEPLEQSDAWLWREDLRGYEGREACVSPGYYQWLAQPGSPQMLVFTTEETHPGADPTRFFEEERSRAASLVELAGAQEDPVLARLAIAADQFLILPESRLEESAGAASHGHVLRTVVAGYYWFLDWGRDTMISMEGLMLATGRHMEARATLLTFSRYVRDGLLPNLFPEGAREGVYHTVDATLWYFHAISRYLQATGDRGLLDELMPTLRDIMHHHVQGTRFGIVMDPDDGLLRASAPHNALTWMDAHMGEWIVTPRRGKPVEIQALWYNALRLMQQWESTGQACEAHARRASQARRSFNEKFWNPACNCLFDVVDGEEGRDARLRPNQLFAIALDHPVLERTHWAAVLDAVGAELLTPVGLRTLARTDAAYSSNYHGNLRSRDAAYHQGTVWPWLLGAYIDAWLKVHGDAAGARALLEEFPRHLHVAGLGSISEVFDGDPPHTPHGCVAQAWSVAEVLRCWKRTCAGAR